MVSFRTGASRAPSVPASRPFDVASPVAVPVRTSARPGSGNLAGDAAIRRDFEALAGRIRILQRRVAREAAALSAH